MKSRSFPIMYFYQTIGFLTCVLILLPPLFQLLNRRNLIDWWHFPIAVMFFMLIGSSITFLREKDLYAYAIWGILRDKIEYKDINHLEVIAARHFLFTGNLDVVIRTSTKSSPSVTISFSEYVNWREMVEFLIERLRSENPNFIFDPRLIEKLKQ